MTEFRRVLFRSAPELTARQHLTALANEANAEDLASFIELGLGLYENLLGQRTLRPTV